MSHAAPCGRAPPRSSVLGGGHPAAASIAGLPGRSARVSRKVGPGGLYCSGPSSGSVFGRSPATVGVHELPLSMLLPSDMMPPLQLAGVFAARLVLPEMVPPPLGGGDGVGGLVLSREAKASFRTPPPSAVLVLPSIVKLPSKEMDPVFEKPPPASAVLFWSTLSMRYAVPSLKRPPPWPLVVLPSSTRSVPMRE